MKTYFFFALLCVLVVLPLTAQPQAAGGTSLSMRADWDDGTPVQGTVTLGQVHVVGTDTILATKTLSNGSATVVEPLSTTTIYNVTLASPARVQLLKFPITTALINPQNLTGAEIRVVLRKADSSIKTAHIEVAMGF